MPTTDQLKEFAAIQIRIAKCVTTLTAKAAIVAVNFSKERFRTGYWLDHAAVQWKKRLNDKDPGRGVLIGKGTAILKKDVQVINVTPSAALVGTTQITAPYAKAHNFGFKGTVTVRAHDRRRMVKVKEKYVTKGGKNRSRTIKQLGAATRVASHVRKMNLPQRQFLGKSFEMNKEIEAMFERELNEAIKG